MLKSDMALICANSHFSVTAYLKGTFQFLSFISPQYHSIVFSESSCSRLGALYNGFFSITSKGL